MRVTRVERIFVDRYLFVQVHTDEGLVGLGEAGAWSYHDVTATAIDKYGEYLTGQDPLLIEHHWQSMYRSTFFKGAALMAAMSAIDIALWDIAGQFHGVPIHSLLGGAVRQKARVYSHVFGTTIEQQLDGIAQAREQGFTAVGHLNPLLDDAAGAATPLGHARAVGTAIDAVRRYRQVAGAEVDLCIEIHRRLSPAEAVQFIGGIEETLPMFVEDPVTPDNLDEMAYVARNSRVPIATGERLLTFWDFQMLLRREAAQFVRPDVCLVGGISGARKVATLAEANHVGVVPHNAHSPVSTAACLHLAAAAPSFAILEYPSRPGGMDKLQRPDDDAIVEGSPSLDSAGYLAIPTAAGLGVSLRPDAAREFPARYRPVRNRSYNDGSVAS